MFAAWCLMLDAWCLMLDAWCLMLDAWCLNTCQTHPQRVPQRGGGRRPPPFVDGSGKCSSIKHQASVLSQINTPPKLKRFWPDRYQLVFGTRLFQFVSFSDLLFWNMKNKVWYYQSGPQSVSINPYGIPEPPKPLRNCQGLDWVQKTKKFKSLAEILTFLKTRHGCNIINFEQQSPPNIAQRMH